MHTPHIFVANWKMNGSAAMAASLLENIADGMARAGKNHEVVICPPATLLGEAARLLIGTDIHLGGQNCHSQPNGAFTGEISAAMLKEAGCRYVIVGHSERRSLCFENSAAVKQKAEAALAVGLTPIICVGETLSERDAGQAEAVVARQLDESMPKTGHFLVAYEPVWAIGTGRVPKPDDIRAMHARLAAATGGKAPVLYGGSVNAANAREILTIEAVSGVLVGGASLKAEEFCKIVAASG